MLVGVPAASTSVWDEIGDALAPSRTTASSVCELLVASGTA
jgi:hypothetical protein